MPVQVFDMLIEALDILFEARIEAALASIAIFAPVVAITPVIAAGTIIPVAMFEFMAKIVAVMVQALDQTLNGHTVITADRDIATVAVPLRLGGLGSGDEETKCRGCHR